MLFTLENLLSAYLSCRKGKRKSFNALKFEVGFESKLFQLQRELENRSYQPGRSICFVVTYPKLREVFAADFRDRVVHHLLINRIEPLLEPRFTDHSFACRKEKGTQAALSKLKKSINKISKNKTENAYYAQFDVKSFFSSIDKDILFQILQKEIKGSFPLKLEEEVLWLARTIIYHDPTKNYLLKGDQKLFQQIPANKSLFFSPQKKGLPIGNLTSQFFANLYLNQFDHFIKRKLKVRYYFRYVDDLVLLSEDPNQFKSWRREISLFLKEKLKLQLHPKKDQYGSIYSGVNFVGYLTKPDYTLVRRRVVNNLKTKLHYFNQGLLLTSNNQRQEVLPLAAPPTKEELKQLLAVINSYYGLFKHGNCYRLRKNLYQKHFHNLKKYLKPAKDYCYFKIKDKNINKEKLKKGENDQTNQSSPLSGPL